MLTAADYALLLSCADAAHTATLPAWNTVFDAASGTGQEFVIVKTDAGTNALTIAAPSGCGILYGGNVSSGITLAGGGAMTLLAAPIAALAAGTGTTPPTPTPTPTPTAPQANQAQSNAATGTGTTGATGASWTGAFVVIGDTTEG